MQLRRYNSLLIIFILLAATLFALANGARGQGALAEDGQAVQTQTGPGFTYQGRLMENGAPINGTCEIFFILMDAATGGNQIGQTDAQNDVMLIDGRFTVILNANDEFGPQAFTGDARWLQIQVRCPPGVGEISTLAPRQPLTAAPYAQGFVPGAAVNGAVTGDALLNLTNTGAGDGLRVTDAGVHGVSVLNAADKGFIVSKAGTDGLFVCSTGGGGGCEDDPGDNGLEIYNAVDAGVFINHAQGDGIYICTTGAEAGCQEPSGDNSGIEIGNAQYAGLHVHRAGVVGTRIDEAHVGLWVNNASSTGISISRADVDGVFVFDAGLNGVKISQSTNAFWAGTPTADGLYVQSAGFNGLDVTGANLAGYFGGAVQITGGCTGCLLANFGRNASRTALEPGDVVVVTGSQISAVDSVPLLLDVAPVEGPGAVIGVVIGRAEEVTLENPRPSEKGRRLIPREGPAKPGEFVTIATYGLAPVRIASQGEPVVVGQRLTAARQGAARALQTVEVNGIPVNEAAPILGIALEAGDTDGDGRIWMLVNPQ